MSVMRNQWRIPTIMEISSDDCLKICKRYNIYQELWSSTRLNPSNPLVYWTGCHSMVFDDFTTKLVTMRTAKKSVMFVCISPELKLLHWSKLWVDLTWDEVHTTLDTLNGKN